MATSAYDRVLNKRQSNNGNTLELQSTHIQQNQQNAETVVSRDLQDARRYGQRLWQQLTYCGPHPELTAFAMMLKLRPTLEKLEDLSERITPKNPEGYDDPDDPFAVTAVATFRLEVARVEQSTATPI